MLKARGMQLRSPIQLIRPVTYDENVKEVTGTGRVRRLQDPATRAWNFHTALYYKAGGTPWRLVRSPSDFPSCFIGIGFYRSLDQQRVHTSVAQIFNERGQGMILRGGEAYKAEDDRQLHLTRNEMAKLMKGVLGKFYAEWKHWPSRAVVHKTSLFNADEVAGWRERRVLDGRRIDTHVHALAKEIANEAVQGLVGAVTDVIVIARKEGDAEVAGLHADGL